MKKLLFAVLLLLAAITVLTGILWIDRSARAVNVKTNMKDAREHGLTIITAADPAFNDLMAVYAQRHPTAPIEDLKPSSVFVKMKQSELSLHTD